MKVYVVEGTLEEIVTIFPGLGSSSPLVPEALAITSTAAVSPPSESGDEDGAVSVEVARQVLTRRELWPKQLQLLQELYHAHPGTISGSEIQEKIGYSRPEFSGFMGAFGRRLTHTPGYEPQTWFFMQEWDGEQGTYNYSLPATVRQAMELEKLV